MSLGSAGFLKSTQWSAKRTTERPITYKSCTVLASHSPPVCSSWGLTRRSVLRCPTLPGRCCVIWDCSHGTRSTCHCGSPRFRGSRAPRAQRLSSLDGLDWSLTARRIRHSIICGRRHFRFLCNMLSDALSILCITFLYPR